MSRVMATSCRCPEEYGDTISQVRDIVVRLARKDATVLDVATAQELDAKYPRWRREKHGTFSKAMFAAAMREAVIVIGREQIRRQEQPKGKY